MLSYQGAHVQVRRTRGRASERVCECGKVAAHWAYDHHDPEELMDESGQIYSASPDHYIALCASCHRRLDARQPRRCRPRQPVGWLVAGTAAYPIRHRTDLTRSTESTPAR